MQEPLLVGLRRSGHLEPLLIAILCCSFVNALSQICSDCGQIQESGRVAIWIRPSGTLRGDVGSASDVLVFAKPFPGVAYRFFGRPNLVVQLFTRTRAVVIVLQARHSYQCRIQFTFTPCELRGGISKHSGTPSDQGGPFGRLGRDDLQLARTVSRHQDTADSYHPKYSVGLTGLFRLK